MIGRMLDPDIPTMVNREGDQIEFIRVVYRLASGVTKEEGRDTLEVDLSRALSAEAFKRPAEERCRGAKGVVDGSGSLCAGLAFEGSHFVGGREFVF